MFMWHEGPDRAKHGSFCLFGLTAEARRTKLHTPSLETTNLRPKDLKL